MNSFIRNLGKKNKKLTKKGKKGKNYFSYFKKKSLSLIRLINEEFKINKRRKKISLL